MFLSPKEPLRGYCSPCPCVHVPFQDCVLHWPPLRTSVWPQHPQRGKYMDVYRDRVGRRGDLRVGCHHTHRILTGTGRLCCLLETIFPKVIENTQTLCGHGRHAWRCSVSLLGLLSPLCVGKSPVKLSKAGGGSDEADSQDAFVTTPPHTHTHQPHPGIES